MVKYQNNLRALTYLWLDSIKVDIANKTIVNIYKPQFQQSAHYRSASSPKTNQIVLE